MYFEDCFVAHYAPRNDIVILSLRGDIGRSNLLQTAEFKYLVNRISDKS
jgi:hypothetical protein